MAERRVTLPSPNGLLRFARGRFDGKGYSRGPFSAQLVVMILPYYPTPLPTTDLPALTLIITHTPCIALTGIVGKNDPYTSLSQLGINVEHVLVVLLVLA